MQVRVGMSIGHSPEESQWMPDTLTSGQELTDAEKRDAKRRIQGNVALQDSPDGSGDDQPKPRPTSQPTINTMAASAM